MKTETIVINLILGIGVIALALWIVLGDHDGKILGAQYYEVHREFHLHAPEDARWDRENEQWVTPRPDPETDFHVPLSADQLEALTPVRTFQHHRGVHHTRADEPNVRFSWSRTIGLWFAAICTLFVMSFLYRDNPFYKFTEALVVGVSAAFSMVVAFWDMVMPNLIGRLWPEFMQTHISPGRVEAANYWYIVVAILGLMLLWRLAPQGGWIARWPLAFIIGVFAGIRLIAHLEADFAIQIQATILPLFVRADGQFSFWLSLQNTVVVLGVMACLTYFFFSIEHKGIVGKTAKLGIYILMITFGAGFAYTVMGRITLLTQRIEFLVNDWLWLLGG